MELIDKAAVIAEIDRQILLFSSENYKCQDRLTVEERVFTLKAIKDFINTLEVKKMTDSDKNCSDLNADGTCDYALKKTQRVMHCENIKCSRKVSQLKVE